MNLASLFPAKYNDHAWSERLRVVGLDVPPLSSYAKDTTPAGRPFGGRRLEIAEVSGQAAKAIIILACRE